MWKPKTFWAPGCGAGRLAHRGLTTRHIKMTPRWGVGSRPSPPTPTCGHMIWGRQEAIALLLALLLLTFAKPLPLRGPPKRCPPPPASWRYLGDPAYLVVKRGLCMKVLILSGECLSWGSWPLAPHSALPEAWQRAPGTRAALSSRKTSNTVPHCNCQEAPVCLLGLNTIIICKHF